MRSCDKWGVGHIGEASPIGHVSSKGKIDSNCSFFYQPNSYHMMDRRVDKMYTNVTNLIFRLSNGTSMGKEHALLVNAHLVMEFFIHTQFSLRLHTDSCP